VIIFTCFVNNQIFCTEPYQENSKQKIKLLSENTGAKNPGGDFSYKRGKIVAV
jgi:hypothetical protein